MDLDDVGNQTGHVDVGHSANIILLALVLKHQLPACVPVLCDSSEQLLLAAGP